MLFRLTTKSILFVSLGAIKLNLLTPKQCGNCHSFIGNGETGVFSEKAGLGKCWHPRCFKCDQCGELLVDLINFHQNGKVYCGRHYSEIVKPRCAGCEEVRIFDFDLRISLMGHSQGF